MSFQEGTSIVVLDSVLRFGTGMIPSLQFYGDQPFGKTATNKSREGVSIQNPDGYPALLRQLADLMEQEGVETLTELHHAVNRLLGESE